MTPEEVKELFFGEIDCAPVVVGAFADELNMDVETLRKVAGCFGGGMMAGNTCGAVTGAYMVIGLKYGIGQPGQHEQKELMKAKFAEFNEKFHAKYPSVMCRDLLGYDVSQPGQFEKAIESGRMFGFCPVLVSDTIEILKEIL